MPRRTLPSGESRAEAPLIRATVLRFCSSTNFRFYESRNQARFRGDERPPEIGSIFEMISPDYRAAARRMRGTLDHVAMQPSWRVAEFRHGWKLYADNSRSLTPCPLFDALRPLSLPLPPFDQLPLPASE